MSNRAALIGCLLLAVPAQAVDVIFTDISTESGIGAYSNQEGHGSGAAVVDFDADGHIDIFIPQGSGHPDLLYRNLGDGTFDEIGAAVGLAHEGPSRTGLWLDYDADHDLDLVVSNDDPDADTAFRLYRHDPGPTFVDVTAEAGLFKAPIVEVPLHMMGGMCAGDINNDGYVDLFSGQWRGPGHLFLNTGAGGFTDISATSGVAGVSLFQHQAVMHDFDGDGWLDIYVAIDFDANVLWMNQGDNTFVNEAAAAGLDNSMNDMGVALGDYDNDGDVDIYVTNIFDSRQNKHNVLLRNDSVGDALAFTEVAESMGVDDGRFGWGATFFDADHDGDLDLAATNGWRSGDIMGWPTDPSRFFVNHDAGANPFVDEAAAAAFDDTDWGSALIAADLDRDGDQDIVQTCLGSMATAPNLRVLDNRPLAPGSGLGYLVIQPRSAGPNHFGIGAVVTAVIGDTIQTRVITAGSSYMAQAPAEAHFGMAGELKAERVTIRWADGTTRVLTNVERGQVVRVFDTCSVAGCADANADGARDDTCLWWACESNICTATPVVFADISGQFGACTPDGTADGNDRFQALNCFAATAPGGGTYPCEVAAPIAYNVDAGGQFGTCAADGVCDGNDAFHALNAFGGASDCSCPLDGGPMPEPIEPVIVDDTGLRLVASSPRLRPGHALEVDVLLTESLDDLRGYQLHLGTSGGVAGSLRLEDIVIHERLDKVLEADWQAFNLATHQMVAGLDTAGVAAHADAYLATFILRATPDARGTFVVEILHDDLDAGQRSYLFPTPQRGRILISDAPALPVTVH